MAAPNPPNPSAPSAPLLAFTPAEPAREPLLLFAARCPCCGLGVSRSALDDALLCSSNCLRCGGPCLGLPQRETPQRAPPLAVRPVEDPNWTMRN